MSTILLAVVLLALTIWIGGLVFLSFVTAPMAFSVLDQKDAGRFVRALFPRYYRLAIACGVVALLGLLGLGGINGGWVALLFLEIALVVFMVGLTVYSLMLVPQINAARDAGDAQEDRFKQLHKRSVMLNVVVLLLGIGAVIVVAPLMRQVVS